MRIVITGGPSTGKTTTCKEIVDVLGWTTFPEVAQQIIAEGVHHPLKNRAAFQEQVFIRQLEIEGSIAEQGRIAVLDRGIFDGEAYYRMDGMPVPNMFNSVAGKRYQMAFVLDDLGTFVNDGIRFENLEFTRKINPIFEKDCYGRRGIPTLRVPAGTVCSRVVFILNAVNEYLTGILQKAVGLQTVQAQEWMASLSSREITQIRSVISDLTRGYRLLDNLGPSISYYGSVRIKEGSPDYELAVNLSREFANLGFAAVTGGGPGLSEAANKGTKLAGQRSIGINIKLPWEQKVNPWVTESIECANFPTRKMLMERSVGYVIFKGGLGTMDEMSELLNLIQTGHLRKCPVILMGRKFWRGYISQIITMITEGLVTEMIPIVCDTTEEAINAFQNWYRQHRNGNVVLPPAGVLARVCE